VPKGDNKADLETEVEGAGETWPNGEDGTPPKVFDHELVDGTLSRWAREGCFKMGSGANVAP
jgi:hypothetical protein